ncbi:MAG: UDP-N-acetylmuramate--L-alanine ligase [Oscillospiraceae bacterium]|nr:UDP-N-acetylmuramate--L-alanine ligase [Oscillospiraceae bacterium]
MRFGIDELRRYRCVYLIGIGGISMSALALILAEKGFEVRGYDRSESAVLDTLRQAGVTVYLTDVPEAFDGVELVCYTAAVGSEHPQMKLAAACGARIISRAELLGCLASSYSRSVAVAGTHGKSTTTGMLAHLLLQTEGYDPTVAVGAVLPELGAAYRIGKDENFLFEACEYKDSFLSFFPKVAIVLNIQLDHTDYFHSLEQMVGSFQQFFRNAGPDGFCIYNLDCENCRRASEDIEGKALTFSAEGNESADYAARNIDLTGGFARFDVYRRGEFLLHVTLGVPGLHNVSNALAVIAAATLCGLTPEEIASGLSTYRGVSRRFEFLCEWNGAKLYDDYAHHPEEIRATLSAARAMTKGRVVCVFQPHNYSRLRDLFEEFCTAFTDADVLVLTKLYAAREAAGSEVSAALLAERTGAVYLDEKERIPDYLEQILLPGDTVLLVGAGDIGQVTEKFKKSGKIS